MIDFLIIFPKRYFQHVYIIRACPSNAQSKTLEPVSKFSMTTAGLYATTEVLEIKS